ncbi:MAG: 50S ribosomal protein L4 [bacterium]|nr:MAG: 50S ribosomal protein L4 [bacterium]
MASARLYDFSGDMKGKIDLPASLFEGVVHRPVLYDAVRMYLANRRVGSAKTQLRSEVRFTKSKPYRQKGTGRARAGKRSSPIWRGGGVVFGPRPRDYRYALPKRMKRLALKSALVDKGLNDSVVVVEGAALDAPKTKRFEQFLRIAGLKNKRILFVMDHYDDNICRSMRNIPGIESMLCRNMNAYEVLRAEVLVFTREALGVLEEVFTS